MLFNKFMTNDTELDFSDVLIAPVRSEVQSRKDVELTKVYTFKWCPRKISGVGIVAANMDTTGTFEMARVLQSHKMFTALHKHYSVKDLVSFLSENLSSNNSNDNIFISTGIGDKDYDKIRPILDSKLCENVCIDIANGGLTKLPAFVNKLRTQYPNALIMVGNVVDPSLTMELTQSGGDIVKVGVGPGSACLTRRVAGAGRPQLTAIMENAEVAHALGGMVCGDGGIVEIGDVAKAIGAGADFVMIGGMFAGTDEASGELFERRFQTNEINEDGQLIMDVKKYKLFYGMASGHAQDKHNGGLSHYRSSEGRVVEIPYTGPVENIATNIEGGLRSACTYTNSRNLDDLQENVKFYKVRRPLNLIFDNCKSK